MAVGARLRRLRLARGLKQRQLAVLADVSQSAVAQLESGRRGQRPSQTVLASLSKALGLSGPMALSCGSKAEILEFLERGDEDTAIAATHEAFCDLAEAGLETQTDALLAALEPQRLTAAVILAALMASVWRRKESAWLGFCSRAAAVIEIRHGPAAAAKLFAGLF